MSSPVHIDSEKKDILTLGKGATASLDDTTLTAVEEYLINFTETIKTENSKNRKGFVQVSITIA